MSFTILSAALAGTLFAGPLFAGPLLSAAPTCQAGLEWSYVNSLPDDVTAVAWADLNQDGRKDLVFGDTNSGPGTLIWIKNLGAGDYGPFHVIDELGSDITRVLTEDLDGDGVLDVLLLTEVERNIRVYRGLGNGSFDPGADIALAPQNYSSLATGDVDGDGDMDVLGLRNISSDLVWHENLGGFAFASPVVLAAAASPLTALTASDLDLDGDLDVVYTERFAGSVWTVEGLGGGTFSAPSLVTSTLTQANALGVGDFDGDGTLDLAAAGVGSLAWFQLVQGPGLGYVERDRISTGPGIPSRIDAADFDLDGQDELLLDPSSGGPQIRGLVPAGPDFGPVVASFEFFGSAESIFADANDDGLLDVVSALPRLQFAPGEPGGSFGQERHVTTELLGDPEANTFDLDGDGDLDILTHHGIFPFPQTFGSPIVVYERLSEDEFAAPRQVTDPALWAFDPGAADLNGDDTLDLFYIVRTEINSFTSVDSIVVSYADGTGGYGTSTLIQRFPVDDLADLGTFSGDFDGDGDEDLAVFLRDDFTSTGPRRLVTLENLGSGAFAAPRVIADDNRLRVLAASDDNGDGRTDFYLGTSRNTVEVHLADPAAPSGFRLAASAVGQFPGRALQATPIDLGGDGDMDLVLVTDDTGQSSEGVIYYERTATGFGPELPLDQRQLFGANLAANDWDRDGDVDIVYSSGSSPTFFWFEQIGGLLSPIAALPGITTSPGFLPLRSTRMEDADGDGDLDFWIPGFNALRLYRNTLELGTPVCPGLANSTGSGATLELTGSDFAASNGLTLTARGLPAGSTTLFLVADQTGTSQPPASQGTVCLGGAIGRYDAPGQVLSASSGGLARLVLDLELTPNPTLPSPAPAVAGQTLYFQGWYRDANPQLTSNFTEAQSVLLR